MTDPIDINAPFTKLAAAMGEKDDRMFEHVFDSLCQNDLRNASSHEMAFALGVASGTIIRLRRRIAQLERPDEQ